MGPGTFAATALAGFVATTVTVGEAGRGVLSLAVEPCLDAENLGAGRVSRRPEEGGRLGCVC